MTILDQLLGNKGTVSSALGKALAGRVLAEGRTDILSECVELSTYEADKAAFKHVRSGAAKVVELVAEKKPELVAPRLEDLFPALSVREPQTRWMIIRVMGFCAHLDERAARRAVADAERYVDRKEGLCLASSADLFLGDLGALSEEDAERVFPVLERSMDGAITNEQDWLLEALIKVVPNLGPGERARAVDFAERWQDSPRKTTRQRAAKLLELARGKPREDEPTRALNE